MSALVEAFKIKSFDLEPIYEAWPSAPIFHGIPARDQPVDEWLTQIKEGCLARGVPKEYWHKVGQQYLGPRAKARFDELKAVMKNMHGGRYAWSWKRFKTAMRNMGWDIDVQVTEEIKVQHKPSGLWWIGGRGSRASSERDSDVASISSLGSSISKDLPIVPSSSSSDESSIRPPPKRSMSWDFTGSRFMGIPVPKRTSTMSTVETMSTISSQASTETLVSPPPPASPEKNTPKSTPPPTIPMPTPMPTPPHTAEPTPVSTPGEGTTTTAHAPTWLLNATQALSFLTTEHPKTMTAISAVLITVGSIPAIPAISAGVGGAFLASGTAQAIGSIAVGVGSLLKAVSETKQKATDGQDPLKQGTQ